MSRNESEVLKAIISGVYRDLISVWAALKRNLRTLTSSAARRDENRGKELRIKTSSRRKGDRCYYLWNISTKTAAKGESSRAAVVELRTNSLHHESHRTRSFTSINRDESIHRRLTTFWHNFNQLGKSSNTAAGHDRVSTTKLLWSHLATKMIADKVSPKIVASGVQLKTFRLCREKRFCASSTALVTKFRATVRDRPEKRHTKRLDITWPRRKTNKRPPRCRWLQHEIASLIELKGSLDDAVR